MPVLTVACPKADRSDATQMGIVHGGLVIRAAETGVPVSDAWAAYRQALRDIPAQAGFPYNVSWPTEPEG